MLPFRLFVKSIPENIRKRLGAGPVSGDEDQVSLKSLEKKSGGLGVSVSHKMTEPQEDEMLDDVFAETEIEPSDKTTQSTGVEVEEEYEDVLGDSSLLDESGIIDEQIDEEGESQLGETADDILQSTMEELKTGPVVSSTLEDQSESDTDDFTAAMLAAGESSQSRIVSPQASGAGVSEDVSGYVEEDFDENSGTRIADDLSDLGIVEDEAGYFVENEEPDDKPELSDAEIGSDEDELFEENVNDEEEVFSEEPAVSVETQPEPVDLLKELEELEAQASSGAPNVVESE